MRLLLRFDGGAGTPLALDVQLAEDATVGELADHLGSLCGRGPGLTLDGFDHREPVASGGPRSGSTVQLADTCEYSENVTPAPVEVTVSSGSTGPKGQTRQLCYGTNHVAGVLIHVSARVEVRSQSTVTPFVNGERVMGSRRLSSGDLVTLDSGGDAAAAILVRVTDQLVPPPATGPQVQHRIARRRTEDYQTVELDLPAPPDRIRLPGFPLLSAIVPLLMGAGLWLATRSVASSVFIVFSFVYVVASGFEARREARADEQFRLDEFRSSLYEAEQDIAQHHTYEHSARSQRCPDVAEVSSLVRSRSEHLWERPFDDYDREPLAIRLGVARTRASICFKVPNTGRRELREELHRIASQGERADLPVVVDLDLGGGLALIGPGEITTDIARWVLVQLASRFAPDDLRIVVLSDPLRQAAWSWSSWLPHVQQCAVTRRCVVVVDGAHDDDVRAALALLPAESARLLWLGATRSGLPKRVRQVFEVGASVELQVAEPTETKPVGVGYDSFGGSPTKPLSVEEFRVEDLTEDQALPLARHLAPLVPSRSQLDQRGDSSGFGDGVRLGDVLADSGMLGSECAVLTRWERSAAQTGLGAPVGRAGRGVVHLDLKADGPHALVAGTTGSGKSEFLRSMVASLALNHSPDRLTFLLVDYKGGAAFSSLDELPHSVGLITDLDPELAERTLISLRAEVSRRERVLAGLGVVDLDQAWSAENSTTDISAESPVNRVPPSLVVIVDEFATLARELPEFVDGLVDVAQRGRSLGVHLVLATQRPAGVVTDSIRANTSLRVALRVADPEDSTDVVDVPDAAQLPRETPGRALVRIGSTAPVQVQFAYSSAPIRRRARVTTSPLGPGPIAGRVTGFPPAGVVDEPGGRPDGGPTELALAIDTVRAAAILGGVSESVRPCLPPLPAHVTIAALDGHVMPSGEAFPRGPAIGLVDRPSAQRIDPLTVDFPVCGGILVVGASGSGRSTTLATIAATSEMATYLIGPGPADLADGPVAQSLSDTIELTDIERTLRLLRGAATRLAQRRGENSDAPMLVIVDAYAAFEEIHERVNRGEGIDLLHRIAREGRTAGIHLAISAQRRIEVPAGLVSSLGMHVLLRCVSEDEASMLGLPPCAASPDLPPGRGYVNGELVQIARQDGPSVSSELKAGTKIEELPDRVDLPDLREASAGDDSPWSSLVVGVSADDLTPAHLNLEHSHLVVAGRRRSGRTTALHLLASSLRRSVEGAPGSASRLNPRSAATYLIGPRPVANASHWTAAVDIASVGGPNSSGGSGSDELCERLGGLVAAACSGAQAGIPTLLAVDDFTDLLDSIFEAQLEAALAELLVVAEQAPLRLVLCGEIESLTRCYSSALTRIRSGRTAILLQPDTDVHGAIAHCDIPRRDELAPATGRGWLVQDARPVPVQLAHP